MIWCPDIGSIDQQSGTTSSNAPPSWWKQPACVWSPEVVQRKLLDAAGGHCSALIHSLATTQPSPRILSASPLPDVSILTTASAQPPMVTAPTHRALAMLAQHQRQCLCICSDIRLIQP